MGAAEFRIGQELKLGEGRRIEDWGLHREGFCFYFTKGVEGLCPGACS